VRAVAQDLRHSLPSITYVETQALGFLLQRPDLPDFLEIVRLEDQNFSSIFSTLPSSSHDSFSHASVEQ